MGCLRVKPSGPEGSAYTGRTSDVERVAGGTSKHLRDANGAKENGSRLVPISARKVGGMGIDVAVLVLVVIPILIIINPA